MLTDYVSTVRALNTVHIVPVSKIQPTGIISSGAKTPLPRFRKARVELKSDHMSPKDLMVKIPKYLKLSWGLI